MTSQTPEAISQAVQNGSTKKAVPQAPPKRALSQAVDFSSHYIGTRNLNSIKRVKKKIYIYICIMHPGLGLGLGLEASIAFVRNTI